MTITVLPVNDGPDAVDNIVAAPLTEDGADGTVNILLNDTDVDGNPTPTSGHTIDLDPSLLGNQNTVTTAEGVWTYDPATGIVTFNPADNYNGTATIPYTLCDAGMPVLCDTANITFTVVPVNDPPVVDNDTNITNEDTPTVGGDLTDAGDFDPDGTALTVNTTPVSGPSNGTIVLNADGTYVYTPNPNFNGVDVIVVQICDAGNPLPAQCVNQTLTITVLPVNDPPVAVDDVSTTNEDTPVVITVLGNDTDIDGAINPTTVTITVPPVNGTVSVNPTSGQVTYTPNPDFNGTDTFTYQVCDTGTPLPALCDTAVVTVTVNPVNDPPVVDNDVNTTTEDNPTVGGDLTDTGDFDPDGTALTVNPIPVSGPSNGTIVINPDGTYVYTPNPNFNGVDVIVVQICDAGIPLPAQCVNQTLTITVNPVNDGPDAVDNIVAAPLTEDGADGTVNILLNDTDVDGNPTPTSGHTIDLDPSLLGNQNTVTTAEGVWTYDPATGIVTFNPADNYNGTATIPYTLCDAGMPILCDTANITFTVLPVNDPPIVDNDVNTTNEDTPTVGGDLTDTGDFDPDGTALTVNPIPVSGPSNGTIVINPDGTYVYTPNPNFNGVDVIVVQICDAGIPLPAQCVNQTLTITVLPVNDGPDAVDNIVAAPLTEDGADGTVNILLNDTDVDGNPTPTSGHTIDLDPSLLGNQNTVTTAEGVWTYDPATGIVTFNPADNYNGTATIPYTLCDAGMPVLCDTANITFTVVPVNDPPVVDNDTNITNEDTPTVGGDLTDAGDFDPDGTALTVNTTPVSGPSNGTIVLNADGTYVYTPNPNFNGVDVIVVQICDAGIPLPAQCVTQTLTITVLPVNDGPDAVDNIVAAPLTEDGADGTVNILLNDTDVDGNPTPTSGHTIDLDPSMAGNQNTVTTAEGVWTYDPATGIVTFNPADNYNGTATIPYTLCDAGMPVLCDIANITFTVVPVNDPPVAYDDFAITNENVAVVIDVIGNDTDIDGLIDPTSVTITTLPSNGFVSANATTGAVTYTPNTNFSGVDTFIYQVCDTGTPLPAQCDTAMVNVFVHGFEQVACLANAVNPGTPKSIIDSCGQVVNPVLVGSTLVPNPLTCEGTVVWTYAYAQCTGTVNWIFTYNVVRPDFAMPANAGSMVACPSEIVMPVVPQILDYCGNMLTPSAPIISNTPVCEGDVTYTFTFTDCANFTHDWVYTYTIERNDFVMPANAGSTVACAAAITTPMAPAVTDHCGNALTPTGPVVSATPACEGIVTYTYTYTDCEGNAHDWVYSYTIEYEDFTMPANQASTVSCIALAVAPTTLPMVMDNCGATLIPVTQWIGGTYDGCEGTRIYYYQYRDCEGNSHNWSYTYTIEREDFTMPANASSTVACASAVVAPVVPTVMDHCGNVLMPSAPVISAIPTCEGDVTYTYTYVDCEFNTHNWVYTYTIEREDFTMPANAASTVACASAIVTPPVPTVTDNCGNVLTPTGPVVSNTPVCEGDVTYTYTFTDCELNTHDWVYTYTIERNDFVMPANASSTVACAADMVAPILPTVTDNCGSVLTPTGPVISNVPDCEGNVTYTYTYTDCEGNTHNWVYTYTIERNDFVMPANAGSTVACAAAITTPMAPAVTDYCGNALTPTGPVVSATPACEGIVTYTYTYTDCEGNAHDWVYSYTIEYEDFTMPANQVSTVSCIALAVAPTTLPTVMDNCGAILTPVTQWIGGTYDGCEGTRIYYYQYRDCEGNSHNWSYTYTIEREDFTMPANASSTVACASAVVAPVVPTVMDHCGNVLMPSAPVISAIPTCEGDVTYTYTYVDCEFNTHNWVYTYTIEREDFTMPANAASTVACASAIVTPPVPTVTDNCGNILIPAAPVVSAIPTCEGNVTYTFTFTDCEGNSHDWVYTYTIEYEDFDMPADVDATVNCAANIVIPTPPVVVDNCGNTLTPTGPVVSSIPNCEGDATYTFTYTDCEGNTHDWVYTYTVDYQGDLIAPANEGAIIYNINDAVNPGAPASIVDGCGRTVIPVLVGMTTIPTPFECEGLAIWTYRYTACDGVTIANWTFTYTVRGRPNSPTGSAVQEFCYGDGAQVLDLEVIVPAGITVVWYDAPVNGNVVNIDAILVEGLYFAEAVNVNGCVSAIRFTVKVWIDEDCDNDGVLDVEEVDGDTDGDEIVDYLDNDDDGDGILTIDEDGNNNGDWFDDDCNTNGVVDYLDPQSCDFIPNAFSPNGDDYNSVWEIPALVQYPDFTLEVYDRWGNIVYEYSNAGRPSPVWWDGISNGRWNYRKGEVLPTGTYFYIINYNKGTKSPDTGWVYLQNNN